jgi:hypothetical protein
MVEKENQDKWLKLGFANQTNHSKLQYKPMN